jgi:hypothetical protein
MALPWVRLDSNIASHDKIVRLLSEKEGYRAVCVYLFSIGWSGGHGTDGNVPKAVLPLIHGTERIARMLVDHGLWEYNGSPTTYHIRNYEQRQQLNAVSEATKAAMSAAARKTNCERWHGKDCGCWEAGG